MSIYLSNQKKCRRMHEPMASLGPGIFVPLRYAPKLSLPLDTVKVSAGFPSPAADYEESRLDINEYLVRNPVSTFFFPVQGDSMEGAEIHDGDILVVDKSVRARHGHIVIAFIDGQRLVKRLHNRAGRVALIAENPCYPALEIQEGMELLIWGVVIGKFKRFGV
ncbi:MAG: translesion error-prone DNA polymerase V autoproteolytic subunit [Azonexus sp.]